MNRRRELCRNFQRGSCQYGDRCKFLHANQQQPRPNFGFGTQSNLQSNNATTQQRSNPFGFGVQSNSAPSQQQKPNPFGFGVQSNTLMNQQQQKPNPFGFGEKANTTSAKPFENKWTRTSPSTNSTTQKTEAPAASHNCTDPESCKSQIIEDFKNEAPLWKLTCYGHLKYGPCDIVGDVSYEELRAAAYEDAKKGLSLQSIVDRERSLYVLKMNEFDKLLKSPYGSQNQAFNGMNGSPMTTNGGSIPSFQTNAAPSFSSFSQIGTAANFGSNISTDNPGVQGSSFGALSSFHNSSQNFNGFQMKFGTTVGGNNQISALTFGTSSGVSTSALPFGSTSAHPFGSSSVSSTSIFNSGPKVTGSPFPLVSSNQQLSTSSLPNFSPKTVYQSSVVDEEEDGPDDSVWLKEVWDIGEIPDRPPPARLCL